MRQVFDKGFFVGGALASAMIVYEGPSAAEGLPDAAERATRP